MPGPLVLLVVPLSPVQLVTLGIRRVQLMLGKTIIIKVQLLMEFYAYSNYPGNEDPLNGSTG
jgi:hypothetical protein